jgi:hypothetical protein
MPLSDPIVEEMHVLREALSKASGDDLSKIVVSFPEPTGRAIVSPCRPRRVLRIRYPTMILAGAMFIAALVCGLSCSKRPAGPLPPDDLHQVSAQLPREAQQEKTPTATEPILGPDGEEIVFQVHHANFAWGRTSRGFFINARGEVRRFDSFDTPDQVRYPLYLPPNPRHADLLKSFGARPELVSVVPAAELATQRALAQAARNAPLVCGQAAIDAGGIGYQAWVMRGDGVYLPIRLGNEGDVSCRSLSPAGERVKAWLQTVTGMDSLGPILARTCEERPCRSGKECFSVTYCESVADCSWCDSGTVCVEGPDGKKRCSLGDRPHCNDPTCACFGHAVCPGGDGDCRTTTGGTLTCRYP